MLESRGLLIGCLLITACLPIALYSSSGFSGDYLSYWAAYSLAEFGEFLNYNGERTEHAVSIPQIVLLALAYKLTSLPISLLGGIFSIGFALLTVIQTRRLGNLFSPAVGGLAALLTALNPAFLYWAASGTESTLTSWLLVSSILSLVRLTQSGRAVQSISWTLLYLSGIQLSRPEGGLLVTVMLLGCLAFAVYQNRTSKLASGDRLRKSIVLLTLLSVLVMALLAGWRLSYFGHWYPQSLDAGVSILDFSLTSYRYFIKSIMLQSVYMLNLLLFVGVTVFALLTIIRYPARQSPALWVTAVSSLVFLGFIVVSGGEWVLGSTGEWLASPKTLSQTAPLMGIMLAVGICSLKLRWVRYICGGALAALLVMPVFKLLSFDSTGVPVNIGVGYAKKILLHSQGKGMSWFDATNRVHARDITLISNLNEAVAELQLTLGRPVRLMSREPGMVMHHVTKANFGKVSFSGLREIGHSAMPGCEQGPWLQPRGTKPNLSYRELFENWDAYSSCIERPDIIFDILMRPDELEALARNGYSIVYEQNGFKGYGKNRLIQHAFYAVSDELNVALESKNVNLNEEFWRNDDPSLFDPTQNTRFVVIGHGRGMLEGHIDALEAVADLINLQQPHYVFVLGDFVRLSVDEEWDLLDEHFFGRLDAPVVFVPGNHETRSNAAGDDSTYRRRVEPFPDVIETNYVNFLQLNSSLRLPEIVQYLANAFAKIDESKPTILLTHHKVWKAGVPKSRHVTTFTSRQFLPLIDGRVDAMIAGDGAGRFVAEKSQIGVPAFMSGIGMKGRYQPIFFSIGDIGAEGKLDLRPFEVALNPHSEWYSTLEAAPTLPFLLKDAPPIGAD